jgi:hypothetical protein
MRRIYPKGGPVVELDEPIRINGAFHVSTNVIHFTIASAVEAELGALFHNCQTAIIF